MCPKKISVINYYKKNFYWRKEKGKHINGVDEGRGRD